jgi:hypothetical protein
MVETHVGLDGVSPSLVVCPLGRTIVQEMLFVIHLTIQERHRKGQPGRCETLSTVRLLCFNTVSPN